MTDTEIKARGYEPIRDEKQMYFLEDGKYELLRRNGITEVATKTCDQWVAEDGWTYRSVGLKARYVGFRRVPELVANPFTQNETRCSQCGKMGVVIFTIGRDENFCSMDCVDKWDAKQSAFEVPRGFEKKTEFCGAGISGLIQDASEFLGLDLVVSETARHIEKCHAEIDRLATENRTLNIALEEANLSYIEVKRATVPVVDDGFEKKTEFDGWSLETLSEKLVKPVSLMASHIRDCHVHIDKQAAELTALKAGREWVAIESAEQLDAATPGIYQGVHRDGNKRLSAFVKDVDGFRISPHYILETYSHFRLLAPSDFTPPQRKVKIESGEYTREEVLKMLEGNE